MKPSFIPKSSREYSRATTRNNTVEEEDTHPWLFRRGCPKGSIPITRRMPQLAGNNNNATGRNYKHGRKINDKKNRSSREYATVTLEGRSLYGASAHFSVHQPYVESDWELSLAQIWVASENRRTTVEAGWMVNPTIYDGVHKTTFFTYWTADNYQRTGCFNLRCSGFIQTHRNFDFDVPLTPLSEFRGTQHDVKIEIYQDELLNWRLQLRGVEVGYWPRALVSDLTFGARVHNFGGEIADVVKSQLGRHTWTEMGAGLYAEQGLGRAAYVREIEVVVGRPRGHYVTPGPRDRDTSVTNPNCYNLVYGQQDDWEGLHFFYGGTGKSHTCRPRRAFV